jgi:peptide/nickel transport system substrate-binding protein
MTDGKEGIEPPEEIKKIKAIHDKWRQTVVGSPEFNDLGMQYFTYFAEEIPIIGTVGFEAQPMIVSNKLRNVPEKDIFWGADTNFYAPYLPAQWFFKG